MNASPFSRAWTALPVLSLFLVGCSDPEITTYRIPKEAAASAELTPAAASPHAAAPATAPTPAAGAPATMANTAVATASGTDLTWTAPAGWVVKPAAAMRKASYTITAAGASTDLAITAFPGDVGGEVANVNRWRGQLQLPPLSESEVVASLERLTVNGLAVTVVDFTNATSTPPQRILGAMVPFERSTWFFKLLGPEPVVAEAKPAFLRFLQTVKPPSSTP